MTHGNINVNTLLWQNNFKEQIKWNSSDTLLAVLEGSIGAGMQINEPVSDTASSQASLGVAVPAVEQDFLKRSSLEVVES